MWTSISSIIADSSYTIASLGYLIKNKIFDDDKGKEKIQYFIFFLNQVFLVFKKFINLFLAMPLAGSWFTNLRLNPWPLQEKLGLLTTGSPWNSPPLSIFKLWIFVRLTLYTLTGPCFPPVFHLFFHFLSA